MTHLPKRPPRRTFEEQSSEPNQDFILTIDGAIPAGTCDQLVELFGQSGSKQQGLVGHGVNEQMKSSLDLMGQHWPGMERSLSQLVLEWILRYIRVYPQLLLGTAAPSIINQETGDALVLEEHHIKTLSREHLQITFDQVFVIEEIQIQHYRKEQGHYRKWHSENHPGGEPSALRRVLFFILYLNTVSEGGETDFRHQHLRIRPKKGRLVIAPCAFTHTHRGNVPQSGDKFIATSWVSFR